MEIFTAPDERIIANSWYIGLYVETPLNGVKPLAYANLWPLSLVSRKAEEPDAVANDQVNSVLLYWAAVGCNVTRLSETCISIVCFTCTQVHWKIQIWLSPILFWEEQFSQIQHVVHRPFPQKWPVHLWLHHFDLLRVETVTVNDQRPLYVLPCPHHAQKTLRWSGLCHQAVADRGPATMEVLHKDVSALWVMWASL